VAPYVLERKLFLPVPPDEAFRFFDRPENLADVTPAELGFRILTPSPVAMKEGALIDYTIRVLGMPVRWTTLITAYDPPRGFVDQQLRGPYSFWHHTHAFRAVDGGTEMTDTVRYLLPFGPLGALAHAVAVRRQLEGIFDHRSRVIAGRFPGGPRQRSAR
jgi:ligand-binding SRPBCC domain-containing protein